MKHSRWKRIVASGVAALLAGCYIGLSAGQVWAEDSEDTTTSSFDDGILTYTVISGTDVSVTGCESTATYVSIMSEIDGYDVVAIGEEAFAECTSLQSLSIPDSVTEIGDAAFYDCTALTSLTIPNSVTEIPAGCFFGCTALETLTLGSETTTIGDMAFGYCTALTGLTIPDTVESVGDQLFYYCLSLTDIEIPAGITELGAYTFYACMSLETFTIPATLEEVGAMTFLGCQSLETIIVEDGNEYYTVKDNVLYNTDQTILYLYPAGRTDASFYVPDSVLVIYAGAFFSAGYLEEVTFGEGLQYIGEMAFDFCDGLQSITIPKTVTTIGTTAFSDCTSLTSVVFEGAEEESSTSTDSDDALEIGDYAFFCCDSLLDVTLPERVSTIGSYAFGCTEVEEGTDDAVCVETDSDEIWIAAVDGFLLTGYTGVASDYVKDCEVDLNFKALNFDWAKLVLYTGPIAAVLIVILIAVRIIRHNMMTEAEKAALEAERELQAQKEVEQEDDGYQSIIEEEEEDILFSYDQTLPQSNLHHMSHVVTDDTDADGNTVTSKEDEDDEVDKV